MKRLITAILTVLVVYAIYFDVTKGTIPVNTENNIAVPASSTIEVSFFEQKVRPGDTVLTIVEKKINSPLPVSITRVISDFKKLNDGQNPEKILIGKQYRFPDYSGME